MLLDLCSLSSENTVALDSRLQHFLDSELVIEDGAWLLPDLRRGANTEMSSDFGTRTEFECYVNKFFINDFVRETTINLVRKCTLRFALALKGKLANYGRFNVIVSFQDDNCTVRFHLIRVD